MADPLTILLPLRLSPVPIGATIGGWAGPAGFVPHETKPVLLQKHEGPTHLAECQIPLLEGWPTTVLVRVRRAGMLPFEAYAAVGQPGAVWIQVEEDGVFQYGSGPCLWLHDQPDLPFTCSCPRQPEDEDEEDPDE